MSYFHHQRLCDTAAEEERAQGAHSRDYGTFLIRTRSDAWIGPAAHNPLGAALLEVVVVQGSGSSPLKAAG